MINIMLGMLGRLGKLPIKFHNLLKTISYVHYIYLKQNMIKMKK